MHELYKNELSYANKCAPCATQHPYDADCLLDSCPAIYEAS